LEKEEKEMKYEKLKIFSGNSNMELAKEIAKNLGIEVGKALVTKFMNGEIRVKIEENVREVDVFLVQSTSHPVNDNLMELLIMIDALKRASAKRITAVIPFYGYARQDRKVTGREPISAKLVANLLTVAGANRILTVDLHAGQIQGFFDIPVDHLEAVRILAKYFKKINLKNIVVISPDIGGVARARSFSEVLESPLAIIAKRRPKPDTSEVEEIVGDVKDKVAIMVDDMILTGGSLVNGAEALLKKGVREVYAAATHPALCGDAVKTLQESPIKEIVVTNTVFLPEEKRIPKIKILSVAPLISEAIKRIHKGISVSELFKNKF
jgi:ribose-phosphate pyrophosphokinase